MRYYRKNSTKEIIFIDDENSKNLVLAHEEGADAFIYRIENNAIKAIAVYDNIIVNDSAEISAIDPSIWDATKPLVLANLNSYQPPSTLFYKRPKDGFFYCWNETEQKASFLTNPELHTSAFMIFSGKYAEDEIALRKREVMTYEQITQSDWMNRKDQILSILNTL
jgi:hypothetical protein